MGLTLGDMTDRQLLQAYAGGHNLHAFEAFVSRHEGPLLAFAAAVLRDDSGAQDVVQEVFLRVARAPQRLLSGTVSGERNWLLKVARDLSVDCLRRRALERKAVHVLAAAPERLAPAPDAAMQVQEETARMQAAIEGLKPRLRELLILKVREQKSYKEIAQITGLSVTNVGFLLHQALEELRNFSPQRRRDAENSRKNG